MVIRIEVNNKDTKFFLASFKYDINFTVDFFKLFDC